MHRDTFRRLECLACTDIQKTLWTIRPHSDDGATRYEQTKPYYLESRPNSICFPDYKSYIF